eukprot:3379031-Pyramimonas_sp.AAC.1
MPGHGKGMEGGVGRVWARNRSVGGHISRGSKRWRCRGMEEGHGGGCWSSSGGGHGGECWSSLGEKSLGGGSQKQR